MPEDKSAPDATPAATTPAAAAPAAAAPAAAAPAAAAPAAAAPAAVAPAAATLPATLDWYRQAANWLVGLSTGAVAIGLTNLERIERSEGHIKVLCGSAGVFFLLAILSGIFFYIWLTALANGLEYREKHSASVDAEADPGRKRELEEKMRRAEGKIARARKWFPRFYWTLMFTFPFGVLLISVAILVSLAQGADKQPSYSIITAPPITINGNLGAMADVIRFEGKSGKAWVMIRDPSGQFRWREVIFEKNATSVEVRTKTPEKVDVSPTPVP